MTAVEYLTRLIVENRNESPDFTRILSAAANLLMERASLVVERDSLKIQLDSCQGALKETIVENSANCDRADKAESERDAAQIRIQKIQQQYDELGKHADELEQSSRRRVQERDEAVQRAELAERAFRHKEAQYDGLRQRCNWFEAGYHQFSDRVWELKPQLAQALQRAEEMERKFHLAAEQNYCTICGNTLDGYEGDKTRQRAETAEKELAKAREEITRLQTTLDTSRERLRDGLHRLRGSAPAEDDKA